LRSVRAERPLGDRRARVANVSGDLDHVNEKMIMAEGRPPAYRPTGDRNGDGGRMRVEIRPAARLRGTNAVALLPALGPALDAVIADPEVDLAHLRVTADWVQYQRSFRPPVMLVPTTGGEALELAVELV
jgi:hypothetical protein